MDLRVRNGLVHADLATRDRRTFATGVGRQPAHVDGAIPRRPIEQLKRLRDSLEVDVPWPFDQDLKLLPMRGWRLHQRKVLPTEPVLHVEHVTERLYGL